MKSFPSFTIKISILLLVLIVCFFISFSVGLYPTSSSEVWDIIRSKFMDVTRYWDDTRETVVLGVRTPRIIMAILVGGTLSVSGASYQTLFKNPMVSPDLLGVSAGAGFGAALALLQQGTWWQVQSNALFFGIIAVIAAYLISRVFGQQNITVLVLAGVVVSSLFQSLLSIVKTLADTDNTLASITFWLMGSLGRTQMQDVLIMLPATIFSLTMIFLFRHKINALSAGEDEAMTMGVNVRLTKVVVIVASTLITAVAVSMCGIIGWVGMVVPHIARFLVGANYAKLVVASFMIGGILLLLIDNVIRGVSGVELPLGVLTSLVGTPIFVAVLSKAKKAWK